MEQMLNVDELKVGERVGVCGGSWNTACELRMVARRTATQMILDDGSRWNKRGREVGKGTGYYRRFLVSEQEAIERIKDETTKRARRELVREAEDIKLGSISDDGLRMILRLAKDHAI